MAKVPDYRVALSCEVSPYPQRLGWDRAETGSLLHCSKSQAVEAVAFCNPVSPKNQSIQNPSSCPQLCFR